MILTYAVGRNSLFAIRCSPEGLRRLENQADEARATFTDMPQAFAAMRRKLNLLLFHLAKSGERKAKSAPLGMRWLKRAGLGNAPVNLDGDNASRVIQFQRCGRVE